MTGRELIIYILEHNLEDEEILQDGKLIWLMTEEEAAAKFSVGVSTIKLWYERGVLQGATLAGKVFIRKDIPNPMLIKPLKR